MERSSRVRDEESRRRKARLLQVRSQEKTIASKLRNEYRSKKDLVFEQITADVQARRTVSKIKTEEELQNKILEVSASIGSAQESASVVLEEQTAEALRTREAWRAAAESTSQRFRLALNKVESDRQDTERQREDLENRRRIIEAVEKERSSIRVHSARVQTPVSTPLLESDGRRVVNPVEYNQTRLHAPPSKSIAVIERHGSPRVQNENSRKPAADHAHIETELQKYSEADKVLLENERRTKAVLRAHKAAHVLSVEKDRITLERDLELFTQVKRKADGVNPTVTPRGRIDDGAKALEALFTKGIR